jgi:hypothetical protein
MRPKLKERADLTPAEKDLITGQPLFCPACAQAVYAGHCANERCRFYESLVWAEYNVWAEYQARLVTTVRGWQQRSVLGSLETNR